jgi:hypothetical protein
MACPKPATRPTPRTYGGANAVVARRSRPDRPLTGTRGLGWGTCGRRDRGQQPGDRADQEGSGEAAGPGSGTAPRRATRVPNRAAQATAAETTHAPDNDCLGFSPLPYDLGANVQNCRCPASVERSPRFRSTPPPAPITLSAWSGRGLYWHWIRQRMSWSECDLILAAIYVVCGWSKQLGEGQPCRVRAALDPPVSGVRPSSRATPRTRSRS